MRFRLLQAAAAVFGMLMLAPDALAQTPHYTDQPGDVYEIRLERNSETTGDRSSGSSHDRWTVTRRVVALRDQGVELEYDLPANTSRDDRRREWQFPARILIAPGRAPELLNQPEAEKRLQAWLGNDKAKLCGHWIFTWTAVKIDCDPRSVLKTIAGYELPQGISEGAIYIDEAATAPGTLHARDGGANGQIFTADLKVDPEPVRRAHAEADSAVTEMMGKQSEQIAAVLRAQAPDRITGTIAVTIQTAQDTRPIQRTRVIDMEITDVGGSVSREKMTETVTWTWTLNARP